MSVICFHVRIVGDENFVRELHISLLCAKSEQIRLVEHFIVFDFIVGVGTAGGRRAGLNRFGYSIQNPCVGRYPEIIGNGVELHIGVFQGRRGRRGCGLWFLCDVQRLCIDGHIGLVHLRTSRVLLAERIFVAVVERVTGKFNVQCRACPNEHRHVFLVIKVFNIPINVIKTSVIRHVRVVVKRGHHGKAQEAQAQGTVDAIIDILAHRRCILFHQPLTTVVP